MTSTDLLGFVAAGLVLATFSANSMPRLRLLAIASNVAFIGYGWAMGLAPIVALHALLLPINLWRLVQPWARRRAGPSRISG